MALLMWLNSLMIIILCILGITAGGAPAPESIRIKAEGLADPAADTYRRDKGLMMDALRADARRQLIEKALGTMVESSTLVENYAIIEDRILTRSKGMIKPGTLIYGEPQICKDGLIHLQAEAEVFLSNIKTSLESISRQERVQLIKDVDNVRISVSVEVLNTETPSLGGISRLAENTLKEQLSAYGYRVISETDAQARRATIERDTRLSSQLNLSLAKVADFAIRGQARFRPIHMEIRGCAIDNVVLTSYTVKCVDNRTSEEILFNNKVTGDKYIDEDSAIADVGRIIGSEFSKTFFEEHLMKPSQIYELRIKGLGSYEIGKLFEREFSGLRQVLNVDMRSFDASGVSLFEVELAMSREGVYDMVNNSVLLPLNRKLGKTGRLDLSASVGKVIHIELISKGSEQQITKRLVEMPPISLLGAPDKRVNDIVKNVTTRSKIESMKQEDKSSSSSMANNIINNW